MKRLNIRAVGEKITAVISNSCNSILNRIAIHSPLYKQLHNKFELDINTNKRLEEFKKDFKDLKSVLFVSSLYSIGTVQRLRGHDMQVARLSEPYTVLVVSSEQERASVYEEMRISSGAGQVYTIDEVLERFPKYPVQASFYIFSSVWINDVTKLVNLLYKINVDEERYQL